MRQERSMEQNETLYLRDQGLDYLSFTKIWKSSVRLHTWAETSKSYAELCNIKRRHTNVKPSEPWHAQEETIIWQLQV